MAENGEQGGENMDDLNEELLGGGKGLAKGFEKGKVGKGFAIAELEEVDGEENGEEAFEDVEDEAENAWSFAENAKDIGGADVAGAVFSDIDSFD